MSEAAAASSSARSSSAYTDSTVELISSHLHRLQWDHDVLESEHRVLKDRVALLLAMPVVPLTARAIWCHDGLMQERYDARPGLTRTASLLARLAEDCFAEWRLRAQEPQAEREAAALWELHLQPCYDEG